MSDILSSVSDQSVFHYPCGMKIDEIHVFVDHIVTQIKQIYTENNSLNANEITNLVSLRLHATNDVKKQLIFPTVLQFIDTNDDEKSDFEPMVKCELEMDVSDPSVDYMEKHLTELLQLFVDIIPDYDSYFSEGVEKNYLGLVEFALNHGVDPRLVDNVLANSNLDPALYNLVSTHKNNFQKN